MDWPRLYGQHHALADVAATACAWISAKDTVADVL
jgi:hypothetical protein